MNYSKNAVIQLNNKQREAEKKRQLTELERKLYDVALDEDMIRKILALVHDLGETGAMLQVLIRPSSQHTGAACVLCENNPVNYGVIVPAKGEEWFAPIIFVCCQDHQSSKYIAQIKNTLLGVSRREEANNQKGT